MYDILVLGAGPAGLAAAVAARGRDKSVLVIGNRWQDSPLAKAERVDNYLGLPGRTGMELLEEYHRHAEEAKAEFVTGKALSLLVWNGFSVTVGSQVYQGRALVLAPGVVRQAKYPGEGEYLGRGVSYCATCDGMLYRNRPVVVVGRPPGGQLPPQPGLPGGLRLPPTGPGAGGGHPLYESGAAGREG